MRIPGLINKNTLEEYTPSPETLKLKGVDKRNVLSEDFQWDKDHVLPLTELCVIAISKNFAQKQILDELPCQDREHLFDVLPTDLALEIVVPLINEESYWKRRYADIFGLYTRPKLPNWTWKSLYIERHVEDMIEQAEPQYNDEEDMSEDLKLCAPYITRLIITQLQAWKPPLTWEKEDIPEIYPIDHINFNPVLSKLVNIEDLDIIYGMNEIGDKFEWRMFDVSVNDIQKLGKAILQLKNIRRFRLHRSAIKCDHTQALIQQLVKNQTLEELDLSNCQIADHGALNIAKLLLVHPKLRVLNVANNRIGPKGATGIGYALQEAAFALETLNIKLNNLEHDGTVGIITGVLHGAKLKNLILAGCGFEDETSIRVCNFLTIDKTLKKIDVSNNWFGAAGGEAMVEAMKANKTLEWLDFRETDMTPDQMAKINKCLLKNRTKSELKEEGEEEEEEEEEGDQGRLAAPTESEPEIVNIIYDQGDEGTETGTRDTVNN